MADFQFSIIIPTYNRANFIGAAIDSVLEQSYQNWELLIIDDGSTDNTADVIRKYTQQDNRVKYFLQENMERSQARNNGIEKSNGKYICFLDSDDAFLPNHLKFFYETILKNKGQSGIYYSDSIITINGNEIIQKLEYSGNENLQTFLFYSSLIPGRVCIKTDILKEFNFDPEISISEDTDLWVRIACKYPYFIPTNQATIEYHMHEGNSVNFKSHNAYKDRQNTLVRILSKQSVHSIDKRIAKNTINDCYMGVFKYYFHQKKYIKAWSTMVGSLFKHPRYRTKEKLYLILTSLYKRDYGQNW